MRYVVKPSYSLKIMSQNTLPLESNNMVLLLAKGRLVGVQFLELFTNNLYLDISRHAINMANKMKKGFLEKRLSTLL